MSNIIKKILGDKQEYRMQMERVHALPKDYQFVFEKMQGYMWSFAGGYGMDMLQTQYDLIDLFEAGAADGRHVLEVTGEDVATFCDELMNNNKLWTNSIRKKLNLKIQNKLN